MTSPQELVTRMVGLMRWIALIGLAGLLLLSGLTVGEVLLRWIFNFPIQGVFDLSQLVIIIIVASCLPLVGAERRHITVRITGTIAGPRVEDVLEAFGALVTMVIFCLMTWQLWNYSNELARSNEATWLMQWPLSPWWRVTTVIIALCAIIQFALFISSIFSGFSSKRDPDIKPETVPQDDKKDITL